MIIWKCAGNRKKQADVNVFLVLDYMENDLFELSRRPDVRFTVPQIKV